MTKQEKDALMRLLLTGSDDMFMSAAHLITAIYQGPGLNPKYTESDTQYNVETQLLTYTQVFTFKWHFDYYKDGLMFFNQMKTLPLLKPLVNRFYRKQYTYTVKTKPYRSIDLYYERDSGANEDPEDDFASVYFQFTEF